MGQRVREGELGTPGVAEQVHRRSGGDDDLVEVGDNRATVYGPVPPERPPPRWSHRHTVRRSASSSASSPNMSHRPGPPWQSTSGGPLPDTSVHSSHPSSARTAVR